MFGFKFGAKSFLGVDIGTSSIKIVELSKNGNKIVLDNYAEVKTALTRRKREGGAIGKKKLFFSDKDIADAIKFISKEAGVQAKEANFSIPDFSSFFTSFTIPAMSKEEIPEAIKYEVRPYVPLPLNEITLDWTITSGQLAKTPLQVLVVAIPNEVISQYREIAHFSGLKLRILEPEAFALARTVVDKEDKKITALIDIGARSTTCSIFEKGIMKISHSFNVAGNQLTDRLAQSLNIRYNEAEKIKRKYGLTLSEKVEDPYKTVRTVLIPLVDTMLEEVKKIFRNFYQSEGKEVEKIVLCGGLSSLPDLKEYFFAELKKEIQICNPFLKVSYPPVLKETLEKQGPSYAVAIGLALKGI